MKNLLIPHAPLCALWLLEREGYPAYIVGGSLRDALRGESPHDWDVTTAARPEQMLEIFKAAGLVTVPTGLKHGTVTLIVDHEPVECTTYRVDGAYTDARHPDEVTFADRIADDLARRDFTVNAMACRLPTLSAFPTLASLPRDGLPVSAEDVELIDLFGGREDLARRVLRCVGDARTRFTEDALRMLRCVRFCVQLGFAPDAQTEDALRACRTGLSKISVERVAAELTRTLSCGAPCHAGLALASRAALWEYVLPEAVLPSPPFATEQAHLAAVDALPAEAELRLALLLCGAGEDGARAACRRLKLSNRQTEAVQTYVSVLTLPLPTDEAALRRAMVRLGEYTERALLLRAVCRPNERAAIAELTQRCATVRARGDALSIGALALDGGDLMRECGLRGREIGQTLARLLDAVLDDPSLNTETALLSLVSKEKK